jgi:hypothetical protein
MNHAGRDNQTGSRPRGILLKILPRDQQSGLSQSIGLLLLNLFAKLSSVREGSSRPADPDRRHNQHGCENENYSAAFSTAPGGFALRL